MIYTTGSGKIEIEITKKQALKGYHSGPCDQDIAELRRIPAIKRQLAKIDEAVLIDELRHWVHGTTKNYRTTKKTLTGFSGWPVLI